MSKTINDEWSMCCPNCDLDGNIKINQINVAHFKSKSFETPIIDEPTWNDETCCFCDSCGFISTVKEFKAKK